jgi:hypothetical protein
MSKDLRELLDELRKKVEDINNLKSLAELLVVTFENEKKDHEKIVEMMRAFSTSDSEIVLFNVGGQIFSTYVSTITKRVRKLDSEDPNDFYEPNLLQGLISGITQVKRDNNNAIFIDRNAKYFNHLLDYLRVANTGEEIELPVSAHDRAGLLKEAAYFKVHGLVDLAAEIYLETSILNRVQVKNLMRLCEFRMHSEFKLIYRGTRDGFEVQNFHLKCDGVARTLILVKSVNGCVFGGYTAVPWVSSGGYRDDPDAFLFSLVNKENEPAKLRQFKNGQSIFCDAAFGPVFGGCDLKIANNAHLTDSGYSYLGSSYAHPKYAYGSVEAKSFLAGAHTFQIAEMEVFNLLN